MSMPYPPPARETPSQWLMESAGWRPGIGPPGRWPWRSPRRPPSPNWSCGSCPSKARTGSVGGPGRGARTPADEAVGARSRGQQAIGRAGPVRRPGRPTGTRRSPAGQPLRRRRTRTSLPHPAQCARRAVHVLREPVFNEVQVQAGGGFGVLYCNPRGSSGYEESWGGRAVARVPTDPGSGWGGVDFDDIMACVDEGCRRFDWVDPSAWHPRGSTAAT